MSILKKGMYASSRIGAIPNQNYLTFSSDQPFSIKFNQKRWDGVLEYSLDAQHWYEWDASEINSAYNTLYLRGSGNTVITNGTGSSHAMIITSNSGVSCTGNIMTLLDHISPETAVMGARCYYSMFQGCTNLTVAPELPATALANYCYQNMFRGSGIEVAPELPATVLAGYCYWGMFYNTGITVAPELPAMLLADNCYESMFRGSGIEVAPELPATVLADGCYRFMFQGCTSLVTAPELPAMLLADNCYESMLRETGIEVAPELPATTLAAQCYRAMFMGCTNLTVAPELPATALANYCYQNMFRDTGIAISETQTGNYQTPWRIPSEGTIESEQDNWNTNMLLYTSGTFTSNPSINTTYYQAG